MKKSLKQILAAGLAFCMAFPSLAVAANADTSLTVGDKVYFGGEVWRVLDSNAVANDSTGQEGILLLSEYVMSYMQWNSDPIDEENATYQSRWDDSEIRAYLLNDFESTLNMTIAESAAIVTAVKGEYTTSDPDYPHRGIGLTGDRFFLLNSEQALYTAAYFPSNEDRIAYDKETGEAAVWWLRSSFNYLNATEVGTSGWFIREDNVVTNTWGVRPAFYLNPSSIISVSEADANGIKTLTLSEALPFTDAQDSERYSYTAVNWVYSKGITYGTSATLFSPAAGCTRAQFVSFLYRLAGEPETTLTESPFTDVTDSAAYYYQAVLWASEMGITFGTGEDTFSPNRVITRQEAIALLYRYAGEPGTTLTESPFTDVTDSTVYYYQAVLWASEMGITFGTSATQFSPSANGTREQMVCFLYRYDTEI